MYVHFSIYTMKEVSVSFKRQTWDSDSIDSKSYLKHFSAASILLSYWHLGLYISPNIRNLFENVLLQWNFNCCMFTVKYFLHLTSTFELLLPSFELSQVVYRIWKMSKWQNLNEIFNLWINFFPRWKSCTACPVCLFTFLICV